MQDPQPSKPPKVYPDGSDAGTTRPWTSKVKGPGKRKFGKNNQRARSRRR